MTEDGSTGVGSTGVGSTGVGSTGPEPEPEAADCDALRDQAACEALSGSDFQCVWFPEAYPATLDGATCSVGEAVGWCIAAFTLGDTGCVEDVGWTCMDGEGVSDVFVRVGDDGSIVLVQDMALEGLDHACGQPLGWEPCNGSGEPSACECACDPGLPQ